MAQGILILGLNGCGKTTVGREVADRLGLLRMDAEDYYFPHSGDYTQSRTEDEVHRLMEEDIRRHGDFVLSCVRCNISEEILRSVQLAAVLRTTPELRAQRIIQREIDRFGDRVFPGGDLYESRQAFHAFAAARSEELVTASLRRLSCPVVELDASLPPAVLTDLICERFAHSKRRSP